MGKQLKIPLCEAMVSLTTVIDLAQDEEDRISGSGWGLTWDGGDGSLSGTEVFSVKRDKV